MTLTNKPVFDNSSFYPWLLALIMMGLLLALAGCGSRAPDSQPQADPGTPPSLHAERERPVIQLTERQAAELNIRHHTVQREHIRFEINAPGRVYGAPGRISVVSSPINGRVSKIYAHEGERVEAGEALLDLESLEFANLVGDYLEASAEVTYQEQQVDRLQVLSDERITPQRTLERALADLRRAKTQQSASMARLRAVGISPEVMHSWDPFISEPDAELTLYAPIGGVLNEHLIELGEAVNAYDKLLDIIDNREVLVRGYVSPSDAMFVRVGTPVIIAERTDAGASDHKRIEGAVTTVNPALDEQNRSIVLNTILPTKDGWPFVGETVRMSYAAEPDDSTFSIPLSAVQFEEQDAAVFVRLAPLQYEKRIVEIARMTQDRAVIRSGLQDGEEIAISQVFSLKALERFEQFAD